MTESDCPVDVLEETNILEDQAYCARNSGKWVAVERRNNRPICSAHADMFEVDARAQKRGYLVGEYRLLRVPE